MYVTGTIPSLYPIDRSQLDKSHCQSSCHLFDIVRRSVMYTQLIHLLFSWNGIGLHTQYSIWDTAQSYLHYLTLYVASIVHTLTSEVQSYHTLFHQKYDINGKTLDTSTEWLYLHTQVSNFQPCCGSLLQLIDLPIGFWYSYLPTSGTEVDITNHSICQTLWVHISSTIF